MMAVFSLLLALQAAPVAERRLVTVREFIVRVESKENAAFRALWVSRDAGRTWATAKDAGVTETWGEWKAGTSRCSVRVPSEGFYDFFPQIGDALSNRGPEPKPGQEADPRLRIEVRDAVKVAHLEWEEPRASTEWTAGQSVALRWHAVDSDFKERTSELSYTTDGDSWIGIGKGLEASGSLNWVVPGRETTQLRLRVRAVTRAGLEATAETEAIIVRGAKKADITAARALYDRARVLHAQGRTVEAKLKYQEALAAWPDFAEVYNDLGKLHAEQREPARALEYFNRARRISPTDPVPVVNAARSEVELGLLEDALNDLRDAVALGLERDERTSVLAGEVLWSIAKSAALAKDDRRLSDACTLILKIRQAARPTQAKARQMLDWLKDRAVPAKQP